MAIGQQFQDSSWQAKHPLSVSYCGITGTSGTVTPAQIEAADSLVLMYNFRNKYQVDSFAIEWDDWKFTTGKNFIGNEARLRISKNYRHDEPYFWINYIYVKNKETGESIHMPSKKIKIK